MNYWLKGNFVFRDFMKDLEYITNEILEIKTFFS